MELYEFRELRLMLRIIQLVIACLGEKFMSTSSNKFWDIRNKEMDKRRLLSYVNNKFNCLIKKIISDEIFH